LARGRDRIFKESGYINNSQDYDADTLREKANDELRKSYGITASGSPMMEAIAKDEIAKRAKRELTDPIEFMKRTYPGRRLWRYIQTHPDLDHMRGLRRLSEEIGFVNFWDTANNKIVTSYRSDADRVDWQFYRRQGSPKLYTRGQSHYAFGKEENGIPGGDNIEILSPNAEIVGACNTAGSYNDISVVIRVHHAGRSVLLPGDAEDMAWYNLVDAYGGRLKADFLKASHHGRDSGYNMEAVRLIAPIMTFVSVGQKPSTDATSKYRNFSRRIASTRYYGNIELRIHDDGSHEWFVQHNAER
jgi:competence protein ComEC